MDLQDFTKCWGYANEQFTSLQRQQRRTLSAEQRKPIIFQQQQLIADELPAISLFYPPRVLVFNRQVFDGWYYTPAGVAGVNPSEENKSTYVFGGPAHA